jgi:peptide/nickel transport system substrate-binding protein
MLSAMQIRSRLVLTIAVAASLSLVACERRAGGCTGAYCGTLIMAGIGEPGTLLPPSTNDVMARDIDEQIFLKLADVGMSLNTIGDEDFQPLLAERWEWDGPLTLVFHIDPRARWHDGERVTAADVSFTFDAYNDSLVASPYRSALRRIASVTQRDSLTAVFRFRERYPEMFYDAVYHMRILPAHLLRGVPREQWKTAAFGRQPVGSGPYKFVSWRAAEAIELAADSTFFLGRPGIRRLIWRITPDMQVAVTQLIADQADVREQVTGPENIERLRAAPHITLSPYRGNTYALLGFNLAANGDATKPHPIFGDREVRRALTMAVDRAKLLRSVLGDFARVPPGPMSMLYWIWDPEMRQLPYDTAQAARLLGARGWRDHDGDGIRDRDGEPFAFHILVTSTSTVRKQYARLLQQEFKAVGVQMEIDEVESTVVGQRASAGKFDAAMFAFSNDPSPISGIPQLWTRAGQNNYLHYNNPAFDRLVERASAAPTRDRARPLWRAAIEIINADAPGVWLFALENVAAIHNRVDNVQIRPDSWAALLRTWRIPSDRLIDRDRVER